MAKRTRRSRGWWLAIPIAAALAGGGYYYYTTQIKSQTSDEPTMQTTRARTGDLVISATAAGTAIASSELSLGFPTDGELLELFVEAGDEVLEGDQD